MSDKSKVAVIGSNSFSGSDFIDLLLQEGRFEVAGISRSPQKGAMALPYLKRDQADFSFHQYDMNNDQDAMLEFLDTFEPRYIVNFAAQSEVAPSWDNPGHWFQTNAVAIAELTNALKDRSYLERYVHISSPEVYGSCTGTVDENAPVNPSTPYAASKAAGDHFLKTLAEHRGFPLVTIRATNVYGAYQQLFKIIPRTFIYLKLGKMLELHGGGVAVKSYIHIRDVSRGELLAMEKGRAGEMYHLSPDAGVAVRDVVDTICRVTGNDFESATKVVGERLGQDAAYVIDSSKARNELGWAPTIGLEDGLRMTHEWVEEFWSEIQKQPLEYIHKA